MYMYCQMFSLSQSFDEVNIGHTVKTGIYTFKNIMMSCSITNPGRLNALCPGPGTDTHHHLQFTLYNQ